MLRSMDILISNPKWQRCTFACFSNDCQAFLGYTLTTDALQVFVKNVIQVMSMPSKDAELEIVPSNRHVA